MTMKVNTMKTKELRTYICCVFLLVSTIWAKSHASVVYPSSVPAEPAFYSTSGMLNQQTSLPSAAWDGVSLADDNPIPTQPRCIQMYNDPEETEEGNGDIDTTVKDQNEVNNGVPIGDMPFGFLCILLMLTILRQYRLQKHN